MLQQTCQSLPALNVHRITILVLISILRSIFANQYYNALEQIAMFYMTLILTNQAVNNAQNRVYLVT